MVMIRLALASHLHKGKGYKVQRNCQHASAGSLNNMINANQEL
jgi:hypothetical protein